MRQQPPLGSRTWKPEEEDYLMEKWGQISVPAIAKKLNRTTNAVKVRAQRLGLGAVLMAGEYVTLNQLLLAVTGGSSSYGYKMKSWVENRGLPVHTKKVNRCSFRVVYIDEFWEWAERYRSFIDFSKMEPLALGEEPDWVAEQRKKDFEAYAIQRKDPWGEDEDSRLKMLLSKHRYSWAEISEMMHRSHGAIARRCRDLGIKDRPVAMELTGKRGTWSSEDNEMLDFIGTDNFKYKLKQAIDAEAADERRASWVERLSSFATQVTDRTGYKFARSFYVNSEVNVERPEDADTVEYFFIVETYYITLMTKDEPTTLTPEEEAKKREEQMNQERKNAAEKALSEATARAYELRADFVATVSAAAIKKRLVDIVALWAYAEYWDDTSWLTEEEIAQATGAEPLAEDDEDGEDDAAFTLQAVTDAIGKTPEKALLRMIYARLGDGKSEGYFRSYWNSYTMKHEENEKLDRIYALLVKLGYEMSDDEKALQDGTHELFGEATDE